MKFAHPVLIISAAVLATACASRQAKTEIPETVPPVKAAPAKESVKASSKESAKESPKKEVPQSVVAGKPVAGNKFAKLKIGMTLSQVERTIGPPTKQWKHATSKASIPYYFGPDRWVVEYSYKGEGVLTLNLGGEQLLTQIEVNRDE